MTFLRKFHNLSMTARVLMAPAVVIVFLLLFGAASYFGLTSQRQALRDIYNNRFKNYQTSASLTKDLTSVHMSTYRLLSWEAARFERAKIDALAKEQLAILDRSVGIIKRNVTSPSALPEEKKIYEAVLPNILEYQKAIQSAIDLSSSDLNFATMYMATADEKFQVLEKVMNQLLDLERTISENTFEHSMMTFSRVIAIMAILLTVALILSLVVSALSARGVTRILGAEPHVLADIARNIAEGNLTFEFGTAETLGGVYADMQKMSANLKDTLSKIRLVTQSLSRVTANMVSSSHNVLTAADVQKTGIEESAASIGEMDNSTSLVAASAESLSKSAVDTSAAVMEMKQAVESVGESSNVMESSTKETAASIEEMIANIKQIGQSLESLSSSSEGIASSVSELNATVKEIERHATESATLSEKVAVEASEKGITAANAAMQGMESIRKSVGSLSEIVNALGKRSMDIGEILTVIEEVTDQTTLLSLNAAILAAQAGSHGTAFTVVADEIKSLSERTELSTNEISGLITSVQEDTLSTVRMVGDCIQAVEKGIMLVSEVNDALKGITKSSRVSTEMSQAIQRSTYEEVQVVKQITESVKEMAKQVENISLALKEQNKGSIFIIEQTEKMREISGHVRTAIEEQRDGSRQIVVSIEDVANQADRIAQATGIQKQKSSEMVQSMDKIQGTTGNLLHSSNEMNAIINALKEDAQNLLSELQKFKV
jgi:methyl-accepting chemotaxis protein